MTKGVNQIVDKGFVRLSRRIMPRKSMRDITEMIRKEWEGKLNSGKKMKELMKGQNELL